MKNIIAVLFVLASTFLQAQAFWIDAEPDTVSDGVFPTATENEAYQNALLLPNFTGTNVGIVAICPLVIKLWSGVPAGWSIFIFDDDEHTTRAFHLDFSGKSHPNDKVALLERIKRYLP